MGSNTIIKARVIVKMQCRGGKGYEKNGDSYNCINGNWYRNFKWLHRKNSNRK